MRSVVVGTLAGAAILAAAGVVSVLPASAQETPFPEAGQRGYGRTVVEGTRPARFEVEILGRLRDVFPQQDLIVARLTGLGLERSGVAAGMSGSPVYIDDRLIGAVAYRLVNFGHEAIAGIVPVEDMLALRDREAGRRELPAASAAEVLAAAGALLTGAVPQPALEAGRALPHGVSAIATPVGLSGIDPVLVQALGPLFARFGWVAAAAGGGASPQLAAAGLEPGSAFGVQLVRGDINVTATGTVTTVEGDTVLGFGHPFMQGGDVDFPIVAAEVITLLSSQAASQKLSAPGTEVLGALRQDRLPGVLGVLGAEPALVPVELELLGAEGSRWLRFEVVDDPMLTPLYLFLGMANGLQSLESAYGTGGMEVEATIELARNHDDVVLDTVFSDRNQAIVSLAAWLSGLFDSVQRNTVGGVEIDSVRAQARFLEGERSARIERAWLGSRTVHPGERVRVHVQLARPQQEPIQRHVDLLIPEGMAAGQLEVNVGDAAAHAVLLALTGETAGAPRDVATLVRRINEAPRADHVYVTATRAAAGVTIGDKPLPALPPSVIDLVTAGAAGTPLGRLHRQAVAAAALDVDLAVSGSATLQLTVRNR